MDLTKHIGKDGQNILFIMQQLRRLCEEIFLLLQTSDSLMAEGSWKGNIGNVFANLSYSLSQPCHWIAQDFIRFYKHEAMRHVLAFVSVLLDDWDNEENLSEPLLTAGWFDYGEGQEVGNLWQYEYARWHLRMPERNDKGLLSTTSHTWPQEPFTRVTTLGVPLVSITTTQQLKDRIIDPLLQNIKEAQKK